MSSCVRLSRALTTLSRPLTRQPLSAYPTRVVHRQQPFNKSIFANLPPRSRQFFTSSRLHRPRHTPPLLSRRENIFDRIPENTVFWTIIGLNGAVFAMWYMSSQRLKIDRDPTAYMWMRDNFTDSWRNLSSGRIWTLATSCFSHEDIAHILFNGFTFFFMARPVLSILGSRGFLALYMGGGMVANIASITWANVIKGRDHGSHGASAAIYSVVSFLACTAPRLTFYLYGVVPVPAWALVGGIFAYDTYSAINDKRKATDTAGHVAGLLAGVGFFLARRFRVF